jgi:protein TonB
MPNALAWPAPLADLPPAQRNFALALAASIVLHALLLSIHFTFPNALDQARERALDIILVNAKSAQRPDKAQARAQANLDGGGNTDENRRAKTPLPVSPREQAGNDLADAQRRVAQREAETRKMMTQAKSQRRLAADDQRSEPAPTAPAVVSGLDLATSARALIQLEAQIARQMEEYNKRPRKRNIGARAEEYRFAQYVEDWRQKIERIGNLNYPESAKGRLYGSLILSVVIRADGSVRQITIDRPSGHKVLDDAARRIVQMAAPYAPFPEAVRRDTDEIEITRTWTFTRSDQVETR